MEKIYIKIDKKLDVGTNEIEFHHKKKENIFILVG